MKKSKKLLATLLGATILTSSLLAGGCGGATAGNPEGAVEGRPSYDTSDAAETYTIWAYGHTSGDHYWINSEPIYFLDEFGNPVSNMTEERMDEWVETNFTRVFIDYSIGGENLDMTDEEWEASEVKKILDYCQTLGLQAFRHGSYANGLSRGHDLRDDDGNYLTSRIWYSKAQQMIADRYTAAFNQLKDAETKRLTALNEEDGSITASVRVTLEATVKAEADAKEEGTFADDNAKTEWINSQIDSRLTAAVEAEIDARSTEYANENKDETAKWMYWRSSAEQYFRSREEYVEYAMNTMEHIIKHPAFIGWSLVDEPPWQVLPLVGETALIFKEAAANHGKEDLYMMFNMLPPADTPGIKPSYCQGGGSMGVFDAYGQFLQHYKEALIDTGALDYFQYDDYPVYNTGVRDTFMRAHQQTSEFARDNDIKSSIVMQSYGSDGTHRFNEYEDVLWQANIGAAFGKTDFSYYTWWPVHNTTDGLLEDRTYPLTRFGERTQLFYSIGRVNGELKYLGKYLTHFKYVDSTYVEVLPLPSGIAMLRDFVRPEEYNKLGVVTIDKETLRFKGQSGGVVLLTELYDEENDQKGYFLVNITDPGVASEAVVTLTFEGYNNVQIVQTNTTSNVGLIENKITLELGTGRGAFIMPY